ncbi:Ribonuclease D [Polystyrenella longa]|uniref:Ribonuclease D n=1 Tax=Polystyrenella longa TaxID=2528007 RepID=A0A518CP75_9PLAN|nr:HRDC domain-containing protein [Polystyrenella longa]QDU81004.1 Ribonuclease D [Polystyrenella longa]
MTTPLIVEPQGFSTLCEKIREVGIVAFDTEFVSEYTYRPELCLLQFAFGDEVAVVDPRELSNLSEWWEIMADPNVTVVVHGGQAEVRFCLEEGQKTPQNLIDIQLAEGLQSRSYPLGYEAIVNRRLNIRLSGKETRTDWRQRPLSERQIEYALEDVRHVVPIWMKQKKSLEKLDRMEWARSEFDRMIQDQSSDRARDPWTRLTGIYRLNKREFQIASLICAWRQSEADKSNRPLKRILRDDLIIELAKRQPRSNKELLETRDINRDGYRRYHQDLIDVINAGLDVPKTKLDPAPQPPLGDPAIDSQVLGQLLSLALSNRCAEANVARQIVGTAADLKHLIRWHLYGRDSESTPRLAEGWRSEICGDLLSNLIDGKISLRVVDPRAENPLRFEQWDSE